MKKLKYSLLSGLVFGIIVGIYCYVTKKEEIAIVLSIFCFIEYSGQTVPLIPGQLCQ